MYRTYISGEAAPFRLNDQALDIQQQTLRILDRLLDADQRADSLAAVHDAVVVGLRQIHHRLGHDFACLGTDHGPLLDRVHPGIPDCGVFKIGVESSEPNTPPLVIV